MVVAALFTYTSLAEPVFRSETNLTNLTRQTVALSLVVLAQYIVVLGRGIDLSVGSTVKLTSLLAAIVMDGSNANLLTGLLVAVAVGAACGAVNGFLVAVMRVAPFIATLGTLALFQGIALSITSVPKGRTSPWLADIYGGKSGPFFHIVLAAALVWVVAHVVIRSTRPGRHLVSVGDDPDAAATSGLHTQRVVFGSFVASGVLSALAGVAVVARAGVGDPNAGFGLEFASLAAVVIGGVSLFGGRGTTIGALGGAVLLGMIGNSFNLLGVEVWYQQLLRGLIILVAAALYIDRVHRSKVARR